MALRWSGPLSMKTTEPKLNSHLILALYHCSSEILLIWPNWDSLGPSLTLASCNRLRLEMQKLKSPREQHEMERTFSLFPATPVFSGLLLSEEEEEEIEACHLLLLRLRTYGCGRHHNDGEKAEEGGKGRLGSFRGTLAAPSSSSTSAPESSLPFDGPLFHCRWRVINPFFFFFFFFYMNFIVFAVQSWVRRSIVAFANALSNFVMMMMVRILSNPATAK